MRRSADEIGATSISSRPKVFSGATSVVDGIFSAHRVVHDKNQPRSRRLRACIEGMMNALGVGERLAEIRKSRKISQAKFVPRRRRRYDPELEHGRSEPNITRLYDAKRGRQPRGEYICRRVTAQTSLSVTASVPMRRQARRSSQRNGTSVVTEMKSRQASGKTCHA